MSLHAPSAVLRHLEHAEAAIQCEDPRGLLMFSNTGQLLHPPINEHTPAATRLIARFHPHFVSYVRVSSLSHGKEDVIAAVKYATVETRVITTSHRYRLQMPERGWRDITSTLALLDRTWHEPFRDLFMANLTALEEFEQLSAAVERPEPFVLNPSLSRAMNDLAASMLLACQDFTEACGARYLIEQRVEQ